ncbi:MAG: helix-turn-helix domain-containing protein [Patescibacteria group bacterium]
MDFLIRDLIHMGLSEKEARVYVSALQLGPSPIQDIAEHAQVNRPTTYVLIESLSDRGLISTTQKENKRVFIAEAPDRLLLILQMQRQELENRERKLTELLPKLGAIFKNQWEKPEIRYLDGPMGLNVLRAEFEQLEGEVVQMIGYDAFASAVDFSATEEHREAMARQFVPTRAIFVTSKQESFDLWGGFEYRVVSPDAFPFAVKGEITVRADHVYLFSYEKGIPLAIDVRSQVIADTHRALFEMVWKNIKTVLGES